VSTHSGNKAEQTGARRIVVIDDDPDLLEFHRFVLGGAGYDVACFQDGNNALEHMKTTLPDLVITDLMMGTLDAGFTLARRIKEDPNLQAVPVMLITAVESQRGFDFRPRTPEDLAAMHADAFLAKPIDPRTLLDKVGELIGRPDGK